MTRNLNQKVLIHSRVQRARAIAPGNERHAEVACGGRLRREDGVAGETGVGEHGGGVGAAAGGLLAVAGGGFAAGAAAGRDVGGELVEGDAEDAACEVAVSFGGVVTWGGRERGHGARDCEGEVRSEDQ